MTVGVTETLGDDVDETVPEVETVTVGVWVTDCVAEVDAEPETVTVGVTETLGEDVDETVPEVDTVTVGVTD